MPPDSTLGYEFGEFTLYPHEQLLLHLNKPVILRGKDLAILTFLVQHADTLIRTTDLIDALWKPRAKLAPGNITNHIAKIRRAIGCDARRPKFIKTIHGKEGYRFIARVERKEHDPNVIRTIAANNQAKVGIRYHFTIHMFVPLFLGKDVYTRIGESSRKDSWVEYKEVQLESARLCINPSGFGVWHLTRIMQFEHMWEAAAWRTETYDEILNGKHVIGVCTKELIKTANDDSVLNVFLGKPGYVLSATILNASSAKRPETVRNILKVLSSLSSLENIKRNTAENQQLDRLEKQFLEDGIRTRNIEEFGLAGVDIGFASWDGISYFHLSSGTLNSLEAPLIEFEIAVQALWWLCKCLMDIRLSNDSTADKVVRKFVPEVKRQFSVIKNIAATESPSQRTMVEAIIATSRVRQMVEEAIGPYK